MKRNNHLFTLFFILFGISSIFGQSTPSGQAKFIVPTTLSACNNDTICIEVLNNRGQKGISYTGNITLEVDIPGGVLMKYIPNSVYSIPTGANEVSYLGNKLTITVPLPVIGSTTKVCFVVMADCNITNIMGLPYFTGKITYPQGFPTLPETFTSVSMNVGVAQISHYLYDNTTYGNPNPAFSSQFRIITWTENVGNGNASEVFYSTVDDTSLTNFIMYVYPQGADGNWEYPSPYYKVATLVSTTPIDGGQRILRVWKATGIQLGLDGLLKPDERLRWDRYMTPPNRCDQFQSRQWWDIKCDNGLSPSCQPNDTLHSTINLAAGTPNLVGKLYEAEDMDGCPNKHIKYSVKNVGAGNAAPVGNAFDINLTIYFGGLMTINNLTLNGIPVPANLLSPNISSAAGSYTINLKNQNTDSFGGAFRDLDGDGFYDDMKGGATTGDSVIIDFDYAVPCELACGANLFYQLTSKATFTDFCTSLKGSSSTPLKNFGFQQVQSIEQTTKDIDYGTFGTTTPPVIKNVHFKFQYKAWNVNTLTTTGKLRINYSKSMEVDANSVLLNGNPLTNAPVMIGTGATYGSPNSPTDNDSGFEWTLTNAEMAALFDNISDSISYDQIRYSCASYRNDQISGDNFQLLMQLKSDLCSDGSTPCNFDLACKKAFSYKYTEGCGVKPCYISDFKMYRESPIGWVDQSEITPIAVQDSGRSWVGDTLTTRIGNFMSGFHDSEPIGYYTNQGNSHAFKDGRWYFSLNYQEISGIKPDKNSPYIFLPNYSTIKIHSYIPNTSNPSLKGTVGPVIFTAPVKVEHFMSNGSSSFATEQNNFKDQGFSPYGGAYGSVINGTGYYCNVSPNSWHVRNICPAKDGYYASNGFTNLSSYRYVSEDETKVNELYYLAWGKVLAEAGYTGNPTDTSIYIEVDLKWQVNPLFKDWNNISELIFQQGSFEHLGNYQNVDYYDVDNSTYFGTCTGFNSPHLSVSKDWKINNPNSTYSANCGLTVCHQIKFNSYQGDYFGNSEVRVPYKIDKIEVTLPSEYAISGPITLQYQQNGATQTYSGIVASATTGNITFTNSAGGDFPRTDDQAGNLIAHELCYPISKIGSAAPTTYRQSIKIYTRDEFDNVIVLNDSMFIIEANPILTVTALGGSAINDDGGACTPGYLDFEIQNNTLFDAPNTYFAAETNANSIFNISDGGFLYQDPIEASDTSRYGGTNLFAKLGTIKAGDRRTIRVFFNTTTCTGTINVFTDWGCAYPISLTPNLSSSTIKTAIANYQAKKPNILSLPIGGSLQITNLCDKHWVEIEVKNSNNANIYNIVARAKVPSNVKIVSGSAQMSVSKNIGGNAAITVGPPATITPAQFTAGYVAIPTPDVTIVGTDSITIQLSYSEPLDRVCGLPGADENPDNTIRIRFQVEFVACPTTTIEQIKFDVSAENYCGSVVHSYSVIPINYIGVGGVVNDYNYTETTEDILMCAANGQTQNVTDTIIIHNLGGHDTLSGLSSGNDSLTLAIFLDNSKFTVSSIIVPTPFGPGVIGTDPQGNPTVRVKVPAGIAVGDSIAMPISYNVTSKVNKLCSVVLAPGNICYFGTFTRKVVLSCPGGLDCTNTLPSIITGTGASFRNFKCCCTMDITASPGSCVPSTNKYTLNGLLTFEGAPTTGNLIVRVETDSIIFPVTSTSPYVYSLPNLPSDGLIHTVTAYYTSELTCRDSTIYTAPLPCPAPIIPCSIVANVVVNGCNSNGTIGNATDDYFTITVSATATNPGGANKYVVAVGTIDPLTGAGGNVLNPGGTTYGTAVVLGTSGQLKADGVTTFDLSIRDSQKRRCFQKITVGPVNPCSPQAPPPGCKPSLCVPVQVTKN